ncbi:thiol reductant ABC exporter subunit CydD [Georgenia sp. Z1491]|uniref:thiol reductant ABC exporter subunit CydD n=1 Tax=Georgenia sp. Z1491 TaxID=3416707 RepID=UPI003CF8D00B
MKPLDPRLLAHARAARRYVVVVALAGATTAALVIAQVLLLARILAAAIEGGATLTDVRTPLIWLGVVLVARALVHGAQESVAHRAATDVVAELRASVLTRALALGPRWRAEHGAETVTLAVRGLDDLEPYLVRYLPQLLLAATVTPATLAVVLGADLTSAILLAVTIPLIPVFMILIGRLTQQFADARLAAMSRLGAQLVDLMAGLATLAALGREHGPARRVRELGRAWSAATMRTLRLAFLSGAVLEFLTSICVALVAVSVGMRLVYGFVGLEGALVCIMLAPEVFRPLREVGTQFHASSDGVAAAEKAFAVLDAPAAGSGTAPAPDLRGATLLLRGLGVRAGDRDRLAPAHLDAEIAPGEVTALVGPSGSGKTTTALTTLGVLAPDAGRALVRSADGTETDLADVDRHSWWEQVAYVPQRPTILPGTVAENVAPGAKADALAAAARATGLDEVLAGLPHGWDTVVGHGGVGLSVGQRQRLALTRALVTGAALVVLDEPTAHLDADAESHVLDAVRALRDAGRTVLVVAHRPALVSVADQVVEVASAEVGTWA